MTNAIEGRVDRSKLKTLVTVSVVAEPEHTAPESHLESDGAAWVYEQLAEGNDWGWCLVYVSVSYGDWHKWTSLGCCSYESEHAFREGGYFDDMVDECVEAIAERMERCLELAGPVLEAR